MGMNTSFSPDGSEFHLTFKSRRPRWWFVAATDCDHSGVHLHQSKIVFTNPGGIFKKHFSYDHQGQILHHFIVKICFMVEEV